LGGVGGEERPDSARKDSHMFNVNTAANILLIVAAVVWILAKQVRPAPVKTRLLVAAPLIMAYFGIKNTPASTWKDEADLAFIAIGAVFSIALGLWRGATIRVWRESDGSWWRAGSKYTLYLWGALLVVRAILVGAADSTGHKAADGLGPILVSLALSFAAQSVVIAMKMSDASAPTSAPTSAPASVSGPAPFDAPAAQPQPAWTQPTSRHDRIQQRRADRRDRRATR
jgi:hypothetical protein